jgi:hypothetical protein
MTPDVLRRFRAWQQQRRMRRFQQALERFSVAAGMSAEAWKRLAEATRAAKLGRLDEKTRPTQHS